MTPDPTLTDEEKDRARRLIQFAKDNPLPLTDEELAEIERAAPGGRDGWLIGRLIAALRASREDLRIANEATLVLVGLAAASKVENERLEEDRERLLGIIATLHHQHPFDPAHAQWSNAATSLLLEAVGRG